LLLLLVLDVDVMWLQQPLPRGCKLAAVSNYALVVDVFHDDGIRSNDMGLV
jgi:hypothetical protein